MLMFKYCIEILSDNNFDNRGIALHLIVLHTVCAPEN